MRLGNSIAWDRPAVRGQALHLAFWVGISFWLTSSFAGLLLAQAEPALEVKLKKALLLKCLVYARWPHESADRSSPFVVGVVGHNPFGTGIYAITNEVVRSRRVVVAEFAAADDVRPCHLLFVSASETKNLPRILARLKDASVLTVGDTEAFTKQGGVMRLVLGQDKLYEISKSAREKSGIEFENELLRFAKPVR